MRIHEKGRGPNSTVFYILNFKCGEKIDLPVSLQGSDTLKEELGTYELRGRSVETFMLCYQTPQQQRLLRKYNNATYLVNVDVENNDVTLPASDTTTATAGNDATGRVLTYLAYALMVQTNIDFQVSW